MTAVKMLGLFAVIFVLQVVTALESQPDFLDGNEYAIVGGDDASINNFPYQLSLRSNGRHICGAAIISSRWALSAAHCVGQPNVAAYSLRAGSSRSDVGGGLYAVQRIERHRQYSGATLDYDICAIQTARPFRISWLVRPIPLDPVTSQFPPGAISIITGWGKLVEGPNTPISRQLQSALLPMVDHAECSRIYRTVRNAPDVTDRMICAGAEPKGRGSCHGDSGGPMAYRGRLVGLVSWGFGCGSRQYPSVYTSIATLRGWVRSTTGV